MKNFIVLFLALLPAFPLSAQPGPRPGFFDGVLFGVGVSAGYENFLGAPKFCAHKEFSLRQERQPKFGFSTYSFYAGAEASVFVFFAGSFSASATAGFALGPVTIDNSLTAAATCNTDGDLVYSWRTYNPKIGLMVGPVWLKAGPSFLVGGDVDMGNWMKKDNTYFNVDLLYVVRGFN